MFCAYDRKHLAGCFIHEAFDWIATRREKWERPSLVVPDPFDLHGCCKVSISAQQASHLSKYRQPRLWRTSVGQTQAIEIAYKIGNPTRADQQKNWLTQWPKHVGRRLR
jgi:hypothetical protein